jgi:hypothetical protein
MNVNKVLDFGLLVAGAGLIAAALGSVAIFTGVVLCGLALLPRH